MGEEDEYACVNKAKLKLKDDSGIKKKKKKKSKETERVIEKEIKQHLNEDKRTKAEIAFQKMQEKMQKQRILQKAEMTHKQRVEKFNQHLDSLTEHFDIPKVSWTK
ncbi:Protein FAM32A-like [Eumeta japonica]|uniref:Protein FAM32A-like n=1 Tax=Eumeta variegata TaxID=151549 RepID=A0A4C1XLZ0_EUMVA|nr:Protein FAM32A-like [Eumeta japonica]